MANKLFSIMQTSFDNFDSTVRQYLSKTFNNLGMQYTHSQIFGVIFDGIKGVMQNALFYVEDALTEQNVFMASRKKSVYSLAKLSGYEPYYGSTATGTLIAKIVVNNGLRTKSSKLYINNHAEIVNKTTGMTYSLILNSNKYCVDVSAPLINHEFKVVQGTWQYAQYVGTGEPLEKISVDITGLFDRDYLNIYIDGEKWEQVSSLYDMYQDSKTYVLTVGYENTFDIVFGNGIYGRIPKSGATVVVEFLVHAGITGNVGINVPSRFEFKTMGYDSLGNNINMNDYITLKVENVISGGTNSDSIDFVREMIGCNSRSNVLASEDNFRLFFKRFSFIGNANCWSDTNSMIINAVCMSTAINDINELNDYYKLTPDSLKLTEAQKAMVVNTLNNSNKTYAGMTLRFEDPVVRRYALQCYVKVKDTYQKSVVEQNIKDAFANYFMNLKDNVQFIPKSDLVQVAVKSNEDIESFDCNIISELAEQAYKDGYYYKYELKFVNETYRWVPVAVYYEKESYPGLDDFGNISLTSKLEVPMLNGGFRYYTDKETGNKKDSITMNAVQIFWIN